MSSINLTDIVANPSFQIMRTNIIIANLQDAPAENRTRVGTVAGYYSTTRPLVLLNLVISITYSYFGHAVLSKPLTFRSPLSLKIKKKQKISIVLLVSSINLTDIEANPSFQIMH